LVLHGTSTTKTFTISSEIDNEHHEIKGISNSVVASRRTFTAEEGKMEISLLGHGEIRLEIPESIGNLTDTETFVYALGPAGQAEEIRTRSVSIDNGINYVSFELPEGSTGVRIMHPSIIPEFPAISVILSVAFVAVIGLTISSRLKNLFLRG
jgi:hypothetical protein